jgi:hypothetical protein
MMSAFTPAGDLDLTVSELGIIDMYTGGESLWINNYLRDRQMEDLDETQRRHLKHYATVFNHLIRDKSPPSKRDAIVYRGAEAMHPDWRQLKAGDGLSFTNKGLISASFNRDSAIRFIEADDDCCLLVLDLPKGTHGLYVSSISRFSGLQEDEIILPHGSRFIVTQQTYTPVHLPNGGLKNILTYRAKLSL